LFKKYGEAELESQEVQFVVIIEHVKHTDAHELHIPLEGTNPKVTQVK
jgi:hypothetical protein